MKFKKREHSRVPRKLKKQIPIGVYCYVPNGKNSQRWSEEYKMFLPTYGVDYCKFHGSIKIKDKPEIEDWEQEFLEENIEWCKLLKYDIMDSCKSCTFKKGH
jgi:hypothetical protein